MKIGKFRSSRRFAILDILVLFMGRGSSVDTERKSVNGWGFHEGLMYIEDELQTSISKRE